MTLKKALSEIQEEILNLLKEKLPPELTYHTYDHTRDVIEATERIARSENVNDNEVMLLKTAAAFHDTGYIYTRAHHEEESCLIAKKYLSEKGVSSDDIKIICELIMSTKVPQKPKNKLCEILCDADLDYLGRDDYFPISQNVYKEFRHFGIVNNESEWKQMQIRFLESHTYFTKTAIQTRNQKKEENLKLIRSGSI